MVQKNFIIGEFDMWLKVKSQETLYVWMYLILGQKSAVRTHFMMKVFDIWLKSKVRKHFMMKVFDIRPEVKSREKSLERKCSVLS